MNQNNIGKMASFNLVPTGLARRTSVTVVDLEVRNLKVIEAAWEKHLEMGTGGDHLNCLMVQDSCLGEFETADCDAYSII